MCSSKLRSPRVEKEERRQHTQDQASFLSRLPTAIPSRSCKCVVVKQASVCEGMEPRRPPMGELGVWGAHLCGEGRLVGAHPLRRASRAQRRMSVASRRVRDSHLRADVRNKRCNAPRRVVGYGYGTAAQDPSANSRRSFPHTNSHKQDSPLTLGVSLCSLAGPATSSSFTSVFVLSSAVFFLSIFPPLARSHQAVERTPQDDKEGRGSLWRTS